jgi:hypothetical protein
VNVQALTADEHINNKTEKYVVIMDNTIMETSIFSAAPG